MLISIFIIWRFNHDRTLIESEDEIAWQHNGHISSSFERWLLQHTQVKSVMKIIRKTHQILSTGETLDNISFTFQVLATLFSPFFHLSIVMLLLMKCFIETDDEELLFAMIVALYCVIKEVSCLNESDILWPFVY